jgi:signal transduction histidine kinase
MLRLLCCHFAFALATAFGADPVTSTGKTNATLGNILNISTLQGVAGATQQLFQVRLQGAVLWQNPNRDRMVLRDETGMEMLSFTTRLPPVVGCRIALAGPCRRLHGRYVIGPVLLVGNDGIHGMREKSESVFLSADRYPVRVSWFNGAHSSGLEVYAAGPDQPRQRIADSAWHRLVDGATVDSPSWTNGLNYQCFEGSWKRLPDFDRLQPVKSGHVANCDISVASRTNDVALLFTGFLEIPRDGVYTFSTVSDDGSQLLLSDGKHVQCEILGKAPLPEPSPVTSAVVDASSGRLRWRDVEGVVDFVSETDSGLSLQVVSGTQRFDAKVADPSEIVLPLLYQSRVRVAGVSQGHYTPDGQWAQGRLLVAGGSQISVLDAPPRQWTTRTATKIHTLLTSIAPPSTDSVIRLIGQIHSVSNLNAIVLKDDTGQIPVVFRKAKYAAEGQWLEMLGQLEGNGTEGRFRCEVCRVLSGPATPGEPPLPVLTSAAQIKGLKREEALLRYPVNFRGVVVSADYAYGIVVHDDTTGVYISGGPEMDGAPPQVGDFLEVQGVTDPGTFAPQIIKAKAVRLGSGIMPVPLRPTRDQLLSGGLDAQYVELQGVLSQVSTKENSLVLGTRSGPITLTLAVPIPEKYRRYENGLVTLRGCVFAVHDTASHQFVIGQMFVDNLTLTVDEPAPKDPFALPAKRVPELLLFDARASAPRRVKLAGVLVHQSDGLCYLMDGTNGFRVLPKELVALAPGDLVEAVGLPELGDVAPVLREAVLRKIGSTNLPPVTLLSETNLLSGTHDATRVRLASRVVEVRTNITEQILELQSGQRAYVARLGRIHGSLQPIQPGSVVEITGVYTGYGGNRAEGREIDSFELLMNSPADVTVLQSPPWWTLKFTLALLGALAVVLSLGLAWIAALRRQVGERTRELTLEIEDHKRTEAKLQEKTERLEREIEERERLQTQLAQSRKMESVGRLAGGVAHEFNNMLQVIIGNAELALEEASPDSSLHQELTSVRRSAQRSAELTKQLLAFARKQVVAPRIIDLNATVSASLRMLHQFVGESIKVNWMPASDLWSVRMDPAQVDQILANLTLNARDAITGQGTVTIRTLNFVAEACAPQPLPDCPPGEYVTIAVSDDGRGMSPEVLEHLFEPFFTTKAFGQGPGLGLAMVFGIVKQNGGAISVESSPNHGTTFRIFLPRAQQPSKAGEEQPEAARANGAQTVLLVEDEPQILELGLRTLQKLGYTVLPASSPDMALELARRNALRIDLLLTDLIMPEMNGKELRQQIESIRPGIKCLFMSGYTADLISEQGDLADEEHFIQKPFTPKELAEKLRTVFEP